ncbi:uncharacterized protein Z519_03367 [Cladophialophora bantiana CBS 173.52]|uniref:Catabolic 3-dehydroquinase n=1 Tax=Cladophialophora bantiana (strain ATCC 10958 / CBS 173.52 / CDC B-1940 / NIH 8579) TaxID=1442370 RepID=A0A0D2HS46_CLAB1|nr:uncharacterized protein Z519_03367 [Cladophialophora bantiana CBS 173.52]KIW96298.1 hypothetical protein Z519_03367 [Cladophialophora bantiana CBS 173.52]
MSGPSSSPPRPRRKLLLINGPNLNLLGTREPQIYGSTTLADVVSAAVSRGKERDIEVVPFQSNHEGMIVDFIQSHFIPPPQAQSSLSATAINETANNKDASTSSPEDWTTPPRTGVVINPAAFTHTSVAIRDALLATSLPFVEVHISNIHAREPWRSHSYFSDKAVGVVMGLGAYGYQAALEFWAQRWDKEDEEENKRRLG